MGIILSGTGSKDKRCIIDDDVVNDCIKKMVEANGIILASPTCFADISAEMKALIDRAGFVARANGEMFRRKVGAAVAPALRTATIHAFDSIKPAHIIPWPGSNC